MAKPAVTAAQAKIQIAKDTVRAFLVESSLSELQNANTPTGIRTMLQKSRVAMPHPVRTNCLYRSQVEKNLKGVRQVPTSACRDGVLTFITVRSNDQFIVHISTPSPL